MVGFNLLQLLNLICFCYNHSDSGRDAFEISLNYTGIRDTSSHLHKFALVVFRKLPWLLLCLCMRCNFPSIFLRRCCAWLNLRARFPPIDLFRRRTFTPAHNCLGVHMYECVSLFESFIHCSLTHLAAFVAFMAPRLAFPRWLSPFFFRLCPPSRAALIHVKFMQIA